MPYPLSSSRCRGAALVGRAGVAGVVAVLLVVGVAAVWFGVQFASARTADDVAAADTTQWYRVKRQSFDLTVIANGDLSARDQVEVRNQVRNKGGTKILTIVPEGAVVQAGDLLVTLDTQELEDQREQETLDVENSRSRRVAGQQDLEIAQSEALSTEKAAHLALELARLELAKWREGEVPQKRRELQLAMEKAARGLEQAERDLANSKELYQADFISLGELEESEVALIEAKDAVATAKLAEEVFQRYEHPTGEQKAAAAVEQAEAELQRALQKNRSSILQAEAELASREKTLRIHEQALAEVMSQIEASTIEAPQDGLVVYATSVGSRRRRGEPLEAGSDVTYGQTLIVLPDTRQMVAELSVHEAQVPLVTVGDPVTIGIDARPGQRIAGTVREIGVMAEEGGWFNPNLREYKVRVSLEGEADASLKPAMRCTGEILTGRVEDAMAVPVQAVYTEGKMRFVYVPAPPGSAVRIEAREVRIGRAAESLVEIKEGLAEGDRVLLRKPDAGELG